MNSPADIQRQARGGSNPETRRREVARRKKISSRGERKTRETRKRRRPSEQNVSPQKKKAGHLGGLSKVMSKRKIEKGGESTKRNGSVGVPPARDQNDTRVDEGEESRSNINQEDPT